MDVFVAGGGFSAIQEAVFLTKYARKVNILVRGEHFKCPRSAVDEAKANPKIKVYYQTVVEEVSGDALPRHARFRNLLSGETWEYRPPKGKTFGVFVFAGYEPATGLVKGKVELSEAGYIITDENKKTSMNGVYAAGDVCVKNLRQLVTAVSDGAVAAAELEKHAAAMQKVSGRIPSQPVTRLPAGENREEAPAARPADPILPDSAGKTASAIETASQEEEASSETEFFFSPDIRAQLDILFTKMERPLILRASLDKRPVSAELRNFLNELAGLSDKLSLDYSGPDEGESTEEDTPCVRICREDGSDTGLAFHGVPGGHEFNAFAIGLYNAAGPGQSLDGELLRRIRELPNQAIQILVSLSCTLCPELVMAAQRIAVENPGISADVYDLNHFPDLKDRYKVMSVPCLVVNARALSFGKKNINELLEILNG
jgi:thioredoxin reductase (NADPH)